MIKAKRVSSPSEPVTDPRSPKRRRQDVVDVIDISSGDDEAAPLNYQVKGKGKAKAKGRLGSESPKKKRFSAPIEILSSREPSPAKDIPGPSAKSKGKARAIGPEVYDVDAFPDLPRSRVGLSSSKVYEIGSSEPEDNLDQQLLMDEDEALAQRLAKEWAEEDAAAPPIPQAANGADASSVSAARSVPVESRKPSLDIPYNNLADPTSALEGFQTLLERSGHCSDCKRSLPTSRAQVQYCPHPPYAPSHDLNQAIFEYPPTQTEGFPPSVGPLVHATCSSRSCQENHCRGCFTSLLCPHKCPGPIPGSACAALACCAEGRAIALYEVLAGFDQQYLTERATSEARAVANLALSKQAQASTVGPGGTGYSTGHSGYAALPASGRGRGRGGAAPAPPPPGQASSSQTHAAHWDRTLRIAFNLIKDLLPSPCSESQAIYDLLPHASTATLLLSSYVPIVLTQLLRNDSVTDWIARNDVYHAMLGLLRRMADSELVIQVLVGRRYEIAQSQGLRAVIAGKRKLVWARDDKGAIELAAPLLEHFKKLTRQSETFLQAASVQLGEGSDDAELLNGFSLCSEIIGARDDIAKAMAVVGSISQATQSQEADVKMADDPGRHGTGGRLKAKGRGRGKAKAKAAISADSFDMEKEYVAACENLAFAHVSLAKEVSGSLVYAEYNYANMLSSTANGTRNPKDRLHMAKELAVMATSLPPGIWVRVDEVRNDAM